MAQNWASLAAAVDDANKAVGEPYDIAVTFTANRVAVLDLLSFEAAGAAAVPTSVTDSLGNVWTKPSGAESVAATNALTKWVAHITTGGAATLSITHGVGMEGIAYIVSHSADVDAADPVVQVVSDSGSTVTATTVNTAALAGATSVVHASLMHQAVEAATPTGSETEIADVSGYMGAPSSGPRGLQAQWRANDTSSSWSWTTSSSWKSIAFEMRTGVSSGSISFPAVPSGLTVRTFGAALASAATAVWGMRGLCGGGACNGGAVSPYDSSKVVAGGDLGGPWYSSDGAVVWDRCCGGINDTSPQHTTGDVEWSQDPTFPNRVWMITSGGFQVSNSWPPSWNLFSTAVQGGEHGDRPRPVGGLIHDTGEGIVYIASKTVVRRYNVPTGSGGADSGGFTSIATGLAGANGIASDPNDIGTVWFVEATFGGGSNSGGVRQISNADTRTTAASTNVAGSPTTACWDLDAIDEGGTTAVYVAAGTSKVRRYVPSTGSWSTMNTAGLPGGNYCAIQARRVSGNTRVVVAIDGSVQVSGNFQQYFATDDAEAASPVWRCLSLDNADMNLIETEGPGGEPWIGYLDPTQGGEYANRFRDESSHTAHDMSMSADGRYVFCFTTGGCYRMDMNLKQVYPMMHQLGTTTNTQIRCHPSSSVALCTNTDHSSQVSADDGVTWYENERGLPGGVNQGTSTCFDPGSTRRSFLGMGTRGANSGGLVWVNADPHPPTFGSWSTLSWPVNVQPIGMDARRVGSRLYLFVAALNGGMKRWDAPTTNITNSGGSWTNCTGGAFASGGVSLQADVWWIDDDLVVIFDKNTGIWRCTNPTGTTPTFVKVHTVTSDVDREGCMRVGWADSTGNTVFISSGGNPLGAFKITDLRTRTLGDAVTTLKRPDGTNFVRPTVMATGRSGGKVIITESKSSTASPAAVYRGSQTGSATLSEDITDQWFADNHVKQADADMTADGSIMLITGRGGGVWGGNLNTTTTPGSQAVAFTKITQTPTVRPLAVAVGPPASQGITFSHIGASSSVNVFAAGAIAPPASQGVTFGTIAASSAANVFAAANPQPPASQGRTFSTVTVTPVVRPLAVAVGPAPSQEASFETIASAHVVHALDVAAAGAAFAPFDTIAAATAVYDLETETDHVATSGRIVGTVTRRQRLVGSVTRSS